MVFSALIDHHVYVIDIHSNGARLLGCVNLLETCSSALISAQISGLHLCPDKSLSLADNSREGGVLHYDATRDSFRKLVSCDNVFGTDECHSVCDVCVMPSGLVFFARTTCNEKS